MAIETRHIDAKAVYDQWYGEFDEKRKTSKGRAWLQQLRATAFQPLAPIALADCLMILGVLKQVCQPEVA